MFVDLCEEVEYDLDEAQDCSVQKQLDSTPKYSIRFNAIILYNILPAVCIEKVVNMKSGEQLYSKMYQSHELPQRIVFKPNLHYGRQDTAKF